MGDPSVVSAAVAVLVGCLMVRALRYDGHALARLGLACGLGYGALTLALFWLGLAGFGVSRFSGAAAALLVTTACVVASRLWRSGQAPRTEDGRREPPWKEGRTAAVRSGLVRGLPPWPRLLGYAAAVGCASLVLYSLLEALYWPVYEWDAVALYDSLARSFFDMGRVDFEGFKTPALATAAWIHYPPFSSMAHVWAYLFGGINPQVVYPLLYASILGVFFGLVRRRRSAPLAAILTLFLATVPLLHHLSVVANSNLPMVFYYSTGALFYAEWVEGRHPHDLTFAAVLLGLSAWTRPGTELFVAPFFLHAGYQAISTRRYGRFVAFVAPFCAVWASWVFVRVFMIYGGDLMHAFFGQPTLYQGHADPVLLAQRVGGYVLDLPVFGVSWVLLFLFIVPALRRHRPAASVALGAIVWNVLVLAIVGYAYGDTGDWIVFMSNSVPRSLMSVMPLALYITSLGTHWLDPFPASALLGASRSIPEEESAPVGDILVGVR